MKVFIAGAAAVAILLAACGDDDASPTASPSESPAASASATPGVARTPRPTLVETTCQANPDPATVRELRVSSPAPGSNVVSPLTIIGNAGASDATYGARLFSEDGTQVGESEDVTITGATPANFSLELTFPSGLVEAACLWVFKLADDSSPENVVQIPLRLGAAPDLGVCLPNPEPATPDVLEIDSPAAGASVSSPLLTSGSAVVLAGELRVTLYDAGGEVIAETDVPTQQPGSGEAEPFDVELPFEVAEETPACLWVWEAGADDSPHNVGQAPLTLLP